MEENKNIIPDIPFYSVTAKIIAFVIAFGGGFLLGANRNEDKKEEKVAEAPSQDCEPKLFASPPEILRANSN